MSISVNRLDIAKIRRVLSAIEDRHLVIARERSIDEMTAYESRSAEDQELHRALFCGADAATSTHAFLESLPLFSSQPPPHTAAAAMKSEAADENPAQREQSNGLPERDLPRVEQRRQQPVPQRFHHFAAEEREQDHSGDRRGHNVNPSLSLHWFHPFVNSS